MRSCIFSIITPVFSVTWSFRNHSNMLICCSRNISDYYQCWKQLCCFIFWWKPKCILFFRILWWIESSKEQHLFEIGIFCNIINAFTVTFDQFNASLMSLGSERFFHEKMTESNSWASRSSRPLTEVLFVSWFCSDLLMTSGSQWVCSRACEWSGAGSERGAERAKYSRSAERVFIQRPERSLCLAPVPLQYRSHHEPRACTNPPRIHLCLQQLKKTYQPTLQKPFVVKERWSSWNISKSKLTGHTGAQFLSKN